MTALRPPFKANDFPSLYKNILAGNYPEIASGYSEDLRLFIKMCLTVNSTRRPSAAQLLETRILSGMELCLEKFDKS
jgi:NIMA (never in mitosis gene a)-related kinase